MSRLSWEGRREIALKAAHAFGLDLDHNIAWRIAMVSDGFPYYIHLIMEKMLWEAFTAEETVDTLEHTHYLAGLAWNCRENAPRHIRKSMCLPMLAAVIVGHQCQEGFGFELRAAIKTLTNRTRSIREEFVMPTVAG